MTSTGWLSMAQGGQKLFLAGECTSKISSINYLCATISSLEYFFVDQWPYHHSSLTAHTSLRPTSHLSRVFSARPCKRISQKSQQKKSQRNVDANYGKSINFRLFSVKKPFWDSENLGTWESLHVAQLFVRKVHPRIEVPGFFLLIAYYPKKKVPSLKLT